METVETTALVVAPTQQSLIQQEFGAMVSPALIREQRVLLDQVIKDQLQEGRDFGPIPGTPPGPDGKPKLVLLQPGAEQLNMLFRLRPEFRREERELGSGHLEVISECSLISIATGREMGRGGRRSCSTMESKYRWRTAERVCPACEQPYIKRSKYPDKKTGDKGWYCFGKIGGCGAQFVSDDPAIVEQQTGRMENPDIADCRSTVRAIADKRAYVAATKEVTASSDRWTDSMEDETGDGSQEKSTEPTMTQEDRIFGPERQKPQDAPVAPPPAATPPQAPNAKPGATSAGETGKKDDPEARKRLLAEQRPRALHAITVALFGERSLSQSQRELVQAAIECWLGSLRKPAVQEVRLASWGWDEIRALRAAIDRLEAKASVAEVLGEAVAQDLAYVLAEPPPDDRMPGFDP